MVASDIDNAISSGIVASKGILIGLADLFEHARTRLLEGHALHSSDAPMQTSQAWLLQMIV